MARNGYCDRLEDLRQSGLYTSCQYSIIRHARSLPDSTLLRADLNALGPAGQLVFSLLNEKLLLQHKIESTELHLNEEIFPSLADPIDLVDPQADPCAEFWTPFSQTLSFGPLNFVEVALDTIEHWRQQWRFRLYDLRSTYATRLSPGGVADEWVTRLLRQGDSQVFKKYSRMKLQMQREALAKLNRHANEMREFGADTVSEPEGFGTVAQ